ncbi:Arylsulfatase [Anatilimnocola aggregata]|uniref:Arylsulfatase n=1 Tax=Anatilimnocola aggregata TaxID=2528021 RepID=A0A517Y972_9BACT|nr:arylsulfatase [Anatilimnocola aggregata]QDU26776.1 Arylsulfatase [Anatilimnocola aggregata]
MLHSVFTVRNLALLVAVMLMIAPVSIVNGQEKGQQAKQETPKRRPNIVFLLADDLGYGDLGCFGQEKIKTPRLDQLARDGMRMMHHYSGNAVCAPSRCVLMTGMHPGHAIVRDNKQIKPQSQFPLPGGTVTLPKLLKEAGYATGAFGKWGLGGEATTGEPMKQHIDRFFGYYCQGVAHNYYPTFLWTNDQQLPLDNPAFPARAKLPAGADINDPKTYAQFSGKQFAPDLIADEAVKFIRDHQGEPFFLFFPTTIPHLALQVPEDGLAAYKGAFPEDPPYDGSKSYLPHRTPRAAYAAMVSRLDSHVGRIFDQINELGLDEDTIYVFSSDNGPLDNRFGGTDTDFFQSKRNLRGFKGSLYEGGVRMPTFVRWKGKIEPGTTSYRVTGFEDWLPTLLDLAGLASAIPELIDGISFQPTLEGQVQPARPFLYREFPGYGGQQSVRVGEWKAVRQKLAQGPAAIELYNIRLDESETNDVAAANPDIVAKLDAIMKKEHLPSIDFPIKGLGDPVPATPAKKK